MFVNTLVLRTRIDPAASFAEFLEQVRTTDLAAFSHADVPFDQVVEAVDPVRSQSHSPLFQVVLSLQNQASASSNCPAAGRTAHSGSRHRQVRHRHRAA